MKNLQDIWSSYRPDLLISISNVIISLISFLLNYSLRNGDCVPILPNKIWEKVSWGHLGNQAPLIKREIRQRKSHPLNIVMSDYNTWNCCHFSHEWRQPKSHRHTQLLEKTYAKSWVLDDLNLNGDFYFGPHFIGLWILKPISITVFCNTNV